MVLANTTGTMHTIRPQRANLIAPKVARPSANRYERLLWRRADFALLVDAVDERLVAAIARAFVGFANAGTHQGGATAYFRLDGYQVLSTWFEHEGRTSAILIAARPTASSHIATVEVSESP
jgi:hypothetical protein